MIRKISLILLLLLAVNCTLSTVRAADSTPSADIRSKLEELKKQIASKAAQLKEAVDRNLQNKAYVGKVKTKSETALTIASETGPKIVNMNQDTVFESQVKGKKFSQKLAAEEDYLATLGDVDETGVLTAKKIILLPASELEVKTSLWGQIVAVSDQLVTLKQKDGKSIAISTPSTVKVNDFVILTGRMGKNDIFDAEFVYIIPQGGILKPKKTATPSASLKPSPTASPSAKKK